MNGQTIIEGIRSVARRIAARTGLVRLARNDRGSVAVEFALISVPFFALILAILETAIVFFAGQALETAVGNAARLVRTGQAQEDSLSASAFKTKICDELTVLFDCSKLYIDVRKYSTFAAIDLSRPVDSDGNLVTDDFQYTPGNGGDIVIVHAYYEWPIYLNQFGNDLSNLGNGKHLLTAAAAFRNEPFPW